MNYEVSKCDLSKTTKINHNLCSSFKAELLSIRFRPLLRAYKSVYAFPLQLKTLGICTSAFLVYNWNIRCLAYTLSM